MAIPEDPRVYFAAERTLLAWIRTGLSAMGLGVVVAKFGVFLRYIAHNDPGMTTRVGHSELVGLALVAVGTATCIAATLQFRRFARTLVAGELPQRYSTGVADVLGWAFAVIGLLLALYLVTPPEPMHGDMDRDPGAPGADKNVRPGPAGPDR